MLQKQDVEQFTVLKNHVVEMIALRHKLLSKAHPNKEELRAAIKKKLEEGEELLRQEPKQIAPVGRPTNQQSARPVRTILFFFLSHFSLGPFYFVFKKNLEHLLCIGTEGYIEEEGPSRG